jgi:hypothetical protein
MLATIDRIAMADMATAWEANIVLQSTPSIASTHLQCIGYWVPHPPSLIRIADAEEDSQRLLFGQEYALITISNRTNLVHASDNMAPE